MIHPLFLLPCVTIRATIQIFPPQYNLSLLTYPGLYETSYGLALIIIAVTYNPPYRPKIPHCSMAMLIGLCIRVKLLLSLPTRFKVIVRTNPGTHASELAVNKQLADKGRVRAVLENVHLVGVMNRCIGNGMIGDGSSEGMV